MKRSKLQKFNSLKNFENVCEYTVPNFKDIVENLLKEKEYTCLELGCGEADYSIELAKANSRNFYIGIDIQGERLWNAAVRSIKEKISNIYFLRMYIDQIAEIFPEKSVDEIWITFPDPYSKKSKADKRLNSYNFLEKYKNICKPNANINFKTDDENLYLYTKAVLEEHDYTIKQDISDIYSKDNLPEELNIKTKFEKKWLKKNKKVYYLQFTLV